MKRKTPAVLVLAALGSLLTTGCCTQRAQESQGPVVITPSGEVGMLKAEPSNPCKKVLVQVPGFWTFADWNWVWIPGYQAEPSLPPPLPSTPSTPAVVRR